MKGLFLDAVDDLADVFRRVVRPDDPPVTVNEQLEVPPETLPALLAGPLAILGLVLGLTLVDFDAEAFRDPDTVLRLGEDAAAKLRASYLLVMLGSYLLLVPLALWWASVLGSRDDPRWRLATVAGLAYLGLGAAGSCILAAVWPDLIEQHADGGDLDTLVVAFRTATRIAEDSVEFAKNGTDPKPEDALKNVYA